VLFEEEFNDLMLLAQVSITLKLASQEEFPSVQKLEMANMEGQMLLVPDSTTIKILWLLVRMAKGSLLEWDIVWTSQSLVQVLEPIIQQVIWREIMLLPSQWEADLETDMAMRLQVQETTILTLTLLRTERLELRWEMVKGPQAKQLMVPDQENTTIKKREEEVFQ